MRIRTLQIVLTIVLFGSVVISKQQKPQESDSTSEPQTVTLYSPTDRTKDVPDESWACFSFNLGTYARCASKDADLVYGFFRKGLDDWFRLMHYADAQTVMNDLGELSWTKAFKVPKLEPLPELKPGKTRKIVIGGEDGIFETKLSAPVWLGHIYALHVKKTDSDFYVLFRVEDFAANQYCKIIWKRIPDPAKKTK